MAFRTDGMHQQGVNLVQGNMHANGCTRGPCLDFFALLCPTCQSMLEVNKGGVTNRVRVPRSENVSWQLRRQRSTAVAVKRPAVVWVVGPRSE